MINTDCVIKKVIGEQGVDIAEKDVEDVINDLNLKASKIEQGNRAKFGELISKLKEDNVEAVDFSFRNKLMNLKSRIEFIKKANNLISDSVTYMDVLEADLVGSNRNIPGFRNSVDARHQAIKAEHTGSILYQFEEAGLTKLITSNKFDVDAVARELYKFTKEDTLRFIKRENEVRSSGGKYDVFEGFSGKGDREAYAIAKIITKEQYKMVTRANRAGAYIKIRPDYIVKQTHDARKIYDSGFNKWYEFIRPLIDDDTTLENVDDVEVFFRNVYEDIVHGKTDLTGGVKLKAGVANKISRERILHFKSDVEFMKYNNVYGKKDLMDTFLNSIMVMSRDIALMEKFGPDPERNFETLLGEIDSINRERRISDSYTKKQLERIDKQEGEGYRRKLRNQFDTVSGKSDIPVLGSWYTFGRETRALNNLSKLGGAGISALADAGALPFEATYNGMGFMSSFWEGIKVPVIEPLKALFNNKTRQQQIEIAKLIGVGMDGLTASTMDRFSINDGFGDSAFQPSHWQKMFFKFNGLNFITDGFKSAFGRMASSNLASKSKMAWSDLGRELTNVLSKFEIGELEWDVIKTTAFEGEDGNMFITPDKIRYLSDDVIKSYIAKKYPKYMKTQRLVEKTRADLETSLRAYFVDRADYASPTPGAKERSVMYRGMRPGTVWGEIARFFWQYKSFATTVVTKLWGREIYGGFSKTSATARMSGMLGLATATGVVAASMKELVKGEVPKAFKVYESAMDDNLLDDRELLFNVLGTGLSQGGGLSIYGDLLFSAMGSTRYGQSPVEALGGPTVNAVGDLFRAFGVGWSEAEKSAIGDRTNFIKNTGQATLRFAGSMAPFGNHPVVRPLKDYVWYNISDSINPGYIRRLKRAHKRQDIDHYFGPLSD